MAEPARKRELDLSDVMEAIGDLGHRVEIRFDGVEGRLDKVENRLDNVENRLQTVEDVQKQQAVLIEKIAELAYKTHLEVVEMRGYFKAIDGRFDGVNGRFVGIEGRFDGIEGRMNGIEIVLRQVPTIWTMATIIIANFGLSLLLLRFGILQP